MEKREYYGFLCPECGHICEEMKFYETGTREYTVYIEEKHGDIEYEFEDTTKIDETEGQCCVCGARLSVPEEYVVKVVFEDNKFKIVPIGQRWKEHRLPEEILLRCYVLIKFVNILFEKNFVDISEAVSFLLERGVDVKILREDTAIRVVSSDG